MSDGDKKQLGRIALRQRAVPASAKADTEALKELSGRYGVPALDLGQLCLKLTELEALPREIAQKHGILPVLARDERMFVAMADPSDQKIIDELEFVSGKKVFPYVAPREELMDLIRQVYVLQSRGESHYIGPRCPPENAQKLASEPDTERPREPSFVGASPADEPSVYMDDQLDRISANEGEIPDDAFGDLSEELSGVTDLPATESSVTEGGKVVLVVDDEVEIRTMLKRILENDGHRVLVAETGGRALRMVKEHRLDLIVLDAMLPEVHGFDIARRIKQSKRYAKIPIVMVSAVHRGWRYAEDMRESCGVEHYIEKPFRIADVQRAVREALAAEPKPDSQAPHSEEAEERLRAGVAAYQAGDIDGAVEHLRLGIRVDPLAYRLHYHLGLLYTKQGSLYDAIATLERAVKINPRHFSGLKNLAILYQKVGLRRKAAEMWERALNHAEDDATRHAIKDHLLALL